MPCLVLLIALAAPRLALFLIWLFSNYLSQVYSSTLWPLLGFLFLPLTTLAYAFAIHQQGQVSGIYLALVVIAALIDLGAIGFSRRGKNKKT